VGGTTYGVTIILTVAIDSSTSLNVTIDRTGPAQRSVSEVNYVVLMINGTKASPYYMTTLFQMTYDNTTTNNYLFAQLPIDFIPSTYASANGFD
jgi:hypothetical protein